MSRIAMVLLLCHRRYKLDCDEQLKDYLVGGVKREQ